MFLDRSVRGLAILAGLLGAERRATPPGFEFGRIEKLPQPSSSLKTIGYDFEATDFLLASCDGVAGMAAQAEDAGMNLTSITGAGTAVYRALGLEGSTTCVLITNQRIFTKSMTPGTWVWAKQSFKAAKRPSGTTVIMQFRDTTGNGQAVVEVTAAGNLRLSSPTAGSVETRNSFCDGAVWGLVLEVDQVAALITLRVHRGVDGALEDLLTHPAGTAAITEYQTGHVSEGTSWRHRLDAIRVADRSLHFAPTLKYSWVAGVTHNSAKIRAQVTGGSEYRLVLTGDDDQTTAGVVLPSSQLAPVDLTGLPGTQGGRFNYQLEVLLEDGSWVPAGPPREFQTLLMPGEVGTQRFVAHGCHHNKAEEVAHEDARAWAPNWRIGLGDQNYSDEESTDPAKHVHWFKQFSRVPSMEEFYGNVAGEDIWSDHDGGGLGNGIYVAAIEANWTSWDARVPHLPLPAGAPAIGARYRAFTTGRVRVILLDTRSAQRVPGRRNPTLVGMLGGEQVEWLTAELVDNALYNSEFVAYIIVSDFVVPVQTSGGKPQLPGKPDSWSAYLTAITEMSTLMTGKRIFMITGDHHHLYGDNGANNPVGGVPFLSCALMARGTGNADGNWTTDYAWPARPGGVSVVLDGQHGYGRITVTDTGAQLTIAATARDALNAIDRFTVTKTWDDLPTADGQITLR